VQQYHGCDTELAMAYGDVYSHAEVTPPLRWRTSPPARCSVERKLMHREGNRLAKLASAQAAVQAQAADYEGEADRAFAQGIASFVAKQAERLTQLVVDAARWKDKYL